MLMLPVNIHQKAANFAALLCSGKRTVDIGATATFFVDGSPQRQLRLKQEVVVSEPLPHGVGVCDIEQSRNIGLIRAMPHQACFGSIAQAQTKRIDKNRLAGAGFSGDDGHSWPELDGKLIDDSQMSDVNVGQHSLSPCRSAWLLKLSSIRG